MVYNFVLLSKLFYEKYPEELYPEIERKRMRPYIVILIEIEDKTFAVPLRHHISHKFAFFTDYKKGCGLDFTKSVVISNPLFIEKPYDINIAEYEYIEVIKNKKTIQTDFERYITAFKKLLIENPKHPIVKYSSLIYFLKELGISTE